MSLASPLAVIGVLALVTNLAGCLGPMDFPAPEPKDSRLGMTRGEGGVPVIAYSPCPDESVDVVSVKVVEPSSGGPDEATLIWEIRANDPRPLNDVRLGDTPPGFHAQTELQDPSPEGVLVVRVSSGVGDEDAVGAFDTSRLRRGTVLTSEGDLVGGTEFDETSRASC